jgi:hypothetical protein
MCVNRPLSRVVAALAVVTMVQGCGYSLAGRGSFLPAYIQTIGVPLLENSTQVFELEQVLTQRLRAEFIGRGKYNVVPEAKGADAVLTGDIQSIAIAPTGFTDERQASRYTVTLSVRIEFRDVKTDKILWQDPALRFSEEYEVATVLSTTDVGAFFGQDTNALDRLATNFARSVVTAIMEAF